MRPTDYYVYSGGNSEGGGGGGGSRPLIGPVRAEGRCLADDQGKFLGLGYSALGGFHVYVHERDRWNENIAWARARGGQCPRIFLDVGPSGNWADREMDPFHPHWQNQLAGLVDDLDRDHQQRPLLSMFSELDHCSTPQLRREAIFLLRDVLRERTHKFIDVEIGNEGRPSDEDEIRDLADILRDAGIPLVSLTSPGESHDLYGGSRATVCGIHGDRDTSGEGGIWRPTRQPYGWRTERDDLPSILMWREPRGPQSSVTMCDDPVVLAIDACMAWMMGNAIYVLHWGAGVRMGGSGDTNPGQPWSPRPPNFWQQANGEIILSALNLWRGALPENLGDYHHHTHANPSKDWRNGGWFPFYTDWFDDNFNRHQTRAYACWAPDERSFVCTPFRCLEPITLIPPFHMHDLKVQHPVTGEILLHLPTAAEGTSWTIDPHPGAVVITGVRA